MLSSGRRNIFLFRHKPNSYCLLSLYYPSCCTISSCCFRCHLLSIHLDFWLTDPSDPVRCYRRLPAADAKVQNTKHSVTCINLDAEVRDYRWSGCPAKSCISELLSTTLNYSPGWQRLSDRYRCTARRRAKGDGKYPWIVNYGWL